MRVKSDTLDTADTEKARKTVVRTRGYDELGRVNEARDDAGHRETWKYDAAGRLTENVVFDGETELSHWRYVYTGGGKDQPLAMEMRATLDGTAYERLTRYRDGLVWQETQGPDREFPLPSRRRLRRQSPVVLLQKARWLVVGAPIR